jgi:membrane-associated phospholipid phosphatase
VVTIHLTWSHKRALQGHVQGVGGEVPRTIASIINLIGGGFSMTVLGVVAFVVGRVFRIQRLAVGALVFGAAGVWCFLLTQTGQLLLAERRPIFGGAMRYLALDGHGISGHASVAALLFFPVRDVVLRTSTRTVRDLVAVLLFSWSLLVAVSRVWMGMHYVWNVAFGLALGWWTGFVAVSVANDTRR